MTMASYLKEMVEKEASDLFLLTGATPSLKVQGQIAPISNEVLQPGYVKQLAYDLMNEAQIKAFEASWEINLAMTTPEHGRFRVNVYQQSNEVAMVLRHIKAEVPDMKTLRLPRILEKLVMQERGLLLFVGATGVGKSTSLASIIDHRNQQIPGHIVIIEDPIEYIHTHKKSIITQREIGIDTMSYSNALKNTLRQAPDVILIGEIRDEDTIQHAIAFSQTGHLCLSTLHANNAVQSIERLVHFFPETQRQQIRLELSFNLLGIISQRLLTSKNGKLIPVFEILLGTPLVKDLINRNELTELQDVMQHSKERGMLTFDMSLFELYREGLITVEEALHHADSQNNLRLEITKHNPSIKIDEELSIIPEDNDKSDNLFGEQA